MRDLLVGRFSGTEGRALLWLCAVIFANQLGFGSTVPVTPLYAQAFGVSQAAIGLTIGVYGLARLLVSLPTGQLADRFGRQPTLLFGELLTAAGNLLCGLATTYEQFLAARFVAGAGAAVVLTSSSIVLADIAAPESRGRVMAVYQGVFLFAVGFGPLPGGLLAAWFGLAAPFYAFTVLGLVAALLAWGRVPETRGIRPGGQAGPPQLPPFRLRLSVLAQNRGFVLVSLVAFLQFFARTGGIFNVVPLMVSARLGLGPGEIGTGLTLVSLINLGLVQLSGLLVDRIGRKPLIAPALLVTGGSLVLLALAPSYTWVVAGFAIWGLATGFGGPAPAAYVADVTPPGWNAVTMSTWRMLGELGYVVGPLLLGALADLTTVETALFFTAGLFLATAILFTAFAPEPRRG